MKRYLTLGIVGGAAAIVVASTTPAAAEPTPRYATSDSVYRVDGWNMSAPDVGGRPGVAFVTRDYRNAAGSTAELSITASPNVKSVYRAGADVPFLGSGYTVESAPPDLVAPVPDRVAQVARRDHEAWVQLAAYGERRGMLGNGVSGWATALFDLALGRPNDYYLVRVLVRDDPTDVVAGVQLADTLFPRLVAFYGSTEPAVASTGSQF